jgi:NADPH2:quinone reductase
MTVKTSSVPSNRNPGSCARWRGCQRAARPRAPGVAGLAMDTEGQFAREAIRLSGGEGVHVVYDGSGPVTFQASLDSLRRCGTFCWYGPVLGGPGALDIMSLPRSIKIGYANFVDHVHTPTLLRTHSAQLFDWIARGVPKVRIRGTYPLSEASRAHADMEAAPPLASYC